MRAIEHSIIRQIPKFAERSPELWESAFKHSSTSQCEQCIPSKQSVLVRKMISDMAKCMASDIQYTTGKGTNPHLIPLCHLLVNARNCLNLCGGPYDFASKLLLKLKIRTCVVPVVMSVQDVRKS